MTQPRAAWLLLARCYIKLGLYALSIVTLNVMPPPPSMLKSETEAIFVVPPEKPKSVTKPLVAQSVDTEEEAALQMDEDEVRARIMRGQSYDRLPHFSRTADVRDDHGLGFRGYPKP